MFQQLGLLLVLAELGKPEGKAPSIFWQDVCTGCVSRHASSTEELTAFLSEMERICGVLCHHQKLLNMC